MVQEAEENAEADKKRKEEVEVRNEADQLIFQVDKTLKELEGKVEADEVKKAEDARDELKSAIEKDDFEEIKSKRDELNEVVQSLTVKLYEQAAQQQAEQEGTDGQEDGQSDSSDDSVVD